MSERFAGKRRFVSPFQDITPAMLAEADRRERADGVPNPYRQIKRPATTQLQEWERRHKKPAPPTLIAEDIATRVRREEGGYLSFETWNTVVRQGSPEELALLCQDSPAFAAELQQIEQSEEVNRLLGQMIARARSEEATVACDASASSPHPKAEPKPCSDAEEQRCQWFLQGGVRPGNLLRDRTLRRPPSCPRRIEFEERMRQQGLRRRQEATARNIPEEVLRVLTDDPAKQQDRLALHEVRAWYRGDRPILVLCGPKGIGKTYAACAWLLAAQTGYRLTSLDLHLCAVPYGAHPAAHTAMKCAAVLLDGLDEDLSPGALQVAERLILGLGPRNARAILTTQLRPDELRALLGGEDTPIGKRLALYAKTVSLYTPASEVAPDDAEMPE
jgi:hypothetical protein